MEPTADPINVPADGHTPEPAALNVLTNGHATDGSALDLDQLLDALQAMQVGDFSVRLPGNQTGLAGKIADTFNEIVAANERMAQQLEHVGQVVGRDGKTRTRVQVRPVRAARGATWRPRSTR